MLELVIVIGVILVLMSLALTVTSVVLAANDRRSIQNTFVLLDQAITSWQSQAGREMTAGRRTNPPGTPGGGTGAAGASRLRALSDWALGGICYL